LSILFNLDSEYWKEEYDDDDDGPIEVDVNSDMPVEKKKKSTGRSKNRSSLPAVEQFEAIDFSDKGPDVRCTATCGDVTISGFWSSGNEVRLPNAVTIAVGGVFINRDEALVGDQKSYLHWLRDRVDHVLMDDIQTDGGGLIYNSHKDAVEFSRRFTSLLMRQVRMSAPEFCQVRYAVCTHTCDMHYTCILRLTQSHAHTHTSDRFFTHTATCAASHTRTHTHKENRTPTPRISISISLPQTLKQISNTLNTTTGND
jgi:hypothetical protein